MNNDMFWLNNFLKLKSKPDYRRIRILVSIAKPIVVKSNEYCTTLYFDENHLVVGSISTSSTATSSCSLGRMTPTRVPK